MASLAGLPGFRDGVPVRVDSGPPDFSGRQCLDGERMDVRGQHVAESGIDAAMAGDRGQAAESLCHDAHPKVAVSAGRSGVSCVQVTFIVDDQFKGRKARLECLPQAFCASGTAHGAVRVLPFSHRTCGTMNNIMAMVMPNTLKFTQTFSGKLRAI